MTTQQLEKLLAEARQQAENNRKVAAILGSVQKWNKIGYGVKIDYGTLDCPLCGLQCLCDGCPIKQYTGLAHCKGTPYYKFGACSDVFCAVAHVEVPGNGYTICHPCCDAIDGMLDLLLAVLLEHTTPNGGTDDEPR